MAVQENRVVVYIIAALVGLLYYTNFVLATFRNTDVDTSTIPSIFGSRILIAIGISIVLTIIGTIAISVGSAIVSRDEEPIMEDERGQLIELRGERISSTLFGMMFIAAMIVLATGRPPLTVFHVIVYGMFGSSIISSVAQLFYFRRGF